MPSTRPEVILGVSADYHDAAAAVVIGGKIAAAAAEERFSRVKHDPSMPVAAIDWCLAAAGVGPGDLDLAVFYSKPLSTYERILVTHAKVGAAGFPNLVNAVGSWTGRKLWVRYRVERTLDRLGHRRVPVEFAEHHQSHAASAFYPSPFDAAAVLTFDGVGEWTTSSIAVGLGNSITFEEELTFPNSLGLFYSAMTSYLGFDVNDGEYKLMGLAPYGEPRFASLLAERVLRIGPDGELDVDQRWFDYQRGTRMTHPRLAALLGAAPRGAAELDQFHADVAASTQDVLEQAVLAVARRAHRLTGRSDVCLAGGVALNCVANARLVAEGPFDRVWVQPAAGDDGGAIGAALWAWHQVYEQPRVVTDGDSMTGAFLGPAFSHAEVAAWLDGNDIEYSVPADLTGEVAGLLAAGLLVGWFDGAMEFGPRALGHRSILADPRDPSVVLRLNRMVKGREDFRPFAPAVLAEVAGEVFELDRPSPYMLFTANVRSAVGGADGRPDELSFAERLVRTRSPIPACTHVDGSARVQTVDRSNPGFHSLLEAFRAVTGCPVLLNTSFNRAGEPVVCTPADAVRTFVATGLDVLAIQGCLVRSDAVRAAA